jgi:hypothetical protein
MLINSYNLLFLFNNKNVLQFVHLFYYTRFDCLLPILYLFKIIKMVLYKAFLEMVVILLFLQELRFILVRR